MHGGGADLGGVGAAVAVISSASVQRTGVAAGLAISPRGSSTVASRRCPAPRSACSSERLGREAEVDAQLVGMRAGLGGRGAVCFAKSGALRPAAPGRKPKCAGAGLIGVGRGRGDLERAAAFDARFVGQGLPAPSGSTSKTIVASSE